MRPPGRAEVAGVAEGEHAAVGANQPVPTAVDGRRDVDDRRVEMGAAHRPEITGVAEGEHAAVRRDQPVAGAIRGGGHAGDRGVEMGAAHRAVVTGVAVGEDSAVAGRHPVGRTPELLRHRRRGRSRSGSRRGRLKGDVVDRGAIGTARRDGSGSADHQPGCGGEGGGEGGGHGGGAGAAEGTGQPFAGGTAARTRRARSGKGALAHEPSIGQLHALVIAFTLNDPSPSFVTSDVIPRPSWLPAAQ